MAIPTFVAGSVLNAAQLNTITTALPIVDAWTDYTPTLTQSATVTKTVTYARYMKVGRKVTVSMRLDITGAGTANNAIVVGLPPFAPVGGTDHSIGDGFVYDASATDYKFFQALIASSTTFKLHPGGTNGYLGLTLSGGLTLASPDSIVGTFDYESTT